MTRKPKHPRCKWCGMRLDHRKHRSITESYCFIRNEKQIRSRQRSRLTKLSDAYHEGKLKAEFIGTDVEDKLMARQQRLALDAILGMGDNGYHVPKNVSHFSDAGFVISQVSHRRPWAVYVLVDGKRKRKRFNNLWEAVKFHKTAQDRYPNSGIVSLARAYDLPPQYRIKKNKYPKKFKWCPHCADFRVFHKVEPLQTFSAVVKMWSTEKQRFVWKVRNVWLTECQLCGHNNRSPVFRRANQPWEVRHIKKGVRKVKPRIRTQRGKLARQRKRKRRVR